MNLGSLMRPRGTLWGFALFLAVNATAVWGGVFPFLPSEFQVSTITVSFFVVQTVSCSLAYALVTLGSYVLPRQTRAALGPLGILPMLLGSCALIAAMYARPWALWLVRGSGVLLGMGSASMMLQWQRVLAAQDSERACMLSVAGTGLSALIYFALCLCPLSVTAFLVPLVFLPLCGTALALGMRMAGAEPTVVTVPDNPREQPRAYASVVRDYWRSGVAVGAIGFVTGVMRAIAIESAEVGQVVNVASMAGALVSSVALIILWRRFSFRFSSSRALRAVFPPLVCCLALLPTLGVHYLSAFAAITYMLFSFSQMTLMVQCLQASHDRGVDVTFTYGLCGGLAVTLQCMGLLAGWGLGLAGTTDAEDVSTAALLCACIMGMALYLVWGGGKAMHVADEAEFLSLAPQSERTHGFGRDIGHVFTPLRGRRAALASHAAGQTQNARGSVSVPALRDRVSKQCEAIRLHYRLSMREAEVMEHIARGDTVPRIAAELEVSENTVRTHAKRIYAKLGIHSKQELGDLIAQFRPAQV